MPVLPFDRQELEPRQLVGPRVVLEPASKHLAESLLEACLESRERLLPYMPWDCWTRAEAEAFLQGADYARREGTRFEFAVMRQSDGRLLGMTGLKICDPFTPVGEVGYWIRASEMGQGFATESLRTLAGACARAGKFARLVAWAATTNTGSRRVLEASGFSAGEIQHRGQCCHGAWHDMVKYTRSLQQEC